MVLVVLVKRHKRSCRFGEKCKRRGSSESIQKEKNGDSDISCLEKQVEGLQTTVADLMAKIENLEQQLRDHKTPTTEINLDTSEEFKCDKCSYVC